MTPKKPLNGALIALLSIIVGGLFALGFLSYMFFHQIHMRQAWWERHGQHFTTWELICGDDKYR